MPRITRDKAIIRKQEALALRLLERSDNDKTPIDVQLDVFEKVGKWVAIKNRIEDDGESQIADFKRRIHGEGPADPSVPPSRRPRRYQPPEGITALKSRVPSRNGGGAVSSGGNSGGEDPAPA